MMGVALGHLQTNEGTFMRAIAIRVIALSAAVVCEGASARPAIIRCDFSYSVHEGKKVKGNLSRDGMIIRLDEANFQIWRGQWTTGTKSSNDTISYKYSNAYVTWQDDWASKNPETGSGATGRDYITIDRLTGKFTWWSIANTGKSLEDALGTCQATDDPALTAPPPAPTKY